MKELSSISKKSIFNGRSLPFTASMLLIALTLSSCEYFVQKEDTGGDKNEIVVARVGENYLYESDLSGIEVSAGAEKDSARIVTHYIENWVKRQLMLKQAEQNSSMSEDEVEKKIEDYRYQLMVYEYQKQYVQQKLNTEVSEKEIQAYYDKEKDNFELKENIVRCHFLKIPLDAPKIDQAKVWFRSSQAKNYEKLKEYGLTNAVKYSYEDSTWFRFDDVVRDSPLQSIPNKTNYLQHHRYIQSKDSAFVYLIKINDYKISNEISPLEFVRDKIQNIIVNKRKTELIKKLEEAIYNDAKRNKHFEIIE